MLRYLGPKKIINVILIKSKNTLALHSDTENFLIKIELHTKGNFFISTKAYL